MKAFIQDLCKRNRQFYEDPRGKGALRDLQQTFPHPWLYVAELLQNAVDEGAKRIHIAVEDGERLIFEHDGKPFDERNVEALCSRGVSSKGVSTVGFMGVGFKAVFRSFESVQISSGSWRFRLTVAAVENEEFGDLQRDWLGAVLPQWEDEALPPSEGMTCRFVLLGRLPKFAPVNFKVKMYQNTRKNMGENQEQKCTTPPHSLAASILFLLFINHLQTRSS